MSNVKRIFLIGHSGEGKVILAEAVAKSLGWQYLNADFALAPYWMTTRGRNSWISTF